MVQPLEFYEGLSYFATLFIMDVMIVHAGI